MKPKPGERSSVSDEMVFFNMDGLRSAVPVITWAEFSRREKASLNLGRWETILETPSQWDNWPDETRSHQWQMTHDWEQWYKNEWKHTDGVTPVEWGTGGHTLFWPDQETVNKHNSRPHWARRAVEYTRELREQKVLSFPSCSGVHAGNDPDWRCVLDSNTGLPCSQIRNIRCYCQQVPGPSRKFCDRATFCTLRRSRSTQRGGARCLGKRKAVDQLSYLPLFPTRSHSFDTRRLSSCH